MPKCKFFVSLLAFFLCLQTHIIAQNSIRYYYYKGQKISLQIDSTSFGVITKDTARLKTIINSLECYSCDMFVPFSDKEGTSFFSVINTNNHSNNFQCADSLGVKLTSTPSTFTTTFFKRNKTGGKGLTNRFYVQLNNIGDSLRLKEYATTYGVDILYAIPSMPDWFVLSCPYKKSSDALDMANLFFESGIFASAEPEFVFKGGVASNDIYYSDQWGLHNTGQYSNIFPADINVVSAWKISKGGNSLVAVYDQGIYTDHPDLIQNIRNVGYDTHTEKSPARLYGKHGTACAGIVAAEENEIGVVGVAPEAGITSISIGLYQYNTSEQYASGFNWARENNVDIINNSWGGIDTSSLIETAIIRAINEGRNGKGCVVVFASGNIDAINTDINIRYPGKIIPEALIVGAISPCGERKNPLSCDHEFWGSCYGEQLDIMAPGVLIPTTDIPGNSGYNPNIPIHTNMAGDLVLSDYDDVDYTVWFNGTSSACPHVSGVAALILSVNPNLHGQEVCNIIEETAKKVRTDLYVYSDTIGRPNGGWNKYMGYGLLDAHRAVLKAAYHKIYGDITFSICDTNIRIYTVRAPHNANIDSVTFFWTCSDNLQMVAGQTTDSVWVKRTNGGIGQLQCHVIHDGDTVVSTLDIPVISDMTVYDNMSLNNGVTFPDTFVLSREIVIDSLSGLTWQDKTVLCTPDCRIVIRPGGAVSFDHTKLTSVCPNRMWQGVEVMGDPSKLQNQQNQGVLYIENGSVIENAYTAVRNRLSTDGVNATTGGIIHAQSSTFRNNSRAVEIYPYTYSSQPGLVSNYFSSFRQCTFTMNDQNLFSANDTAFAEHVRLWGVKGVVFKGCGFSDSTSSPVSGRRGIYTENAGFVLDTHCGIATTECVCPGNSATYSSFSGFTTAVEVNTTGDQYPVTVNEVRFSNNMTGLKINGNQFATVTRNIFNLSDAPFTGMPVVGLDLNGCTGYKVEADTFLRDLNYTTGTAKGVAVHNSMAALNAVYHNNFRRVDYGIYVSGTNGDWKKGLQILCNSFKTNVTDIYVASNSSLYSNQGNSNSSAGNTFDKKAGLDFVNNGSQNINYYYTGGTTSVYYPDQCSGLVTRLSASNANPCTPTLCNNGGGFNKSLSEFQSDMDADTYYESVRALMSDSVLDLTALEQWHTAAQPIADPYSLTETRFMEGYAEMFAADADDAELSNYAEFHAMKLALINDNQDNQNNNNNSSNSQNSPFINWYSLTNSQISQLQTIAERNTGRASVMAKGVLCFFFGICYEDEFEADNQDTDSTAETRAKHVAMDGDGDAVLTVHPNPTDDMLYIELSGAGIANAALYDLQGRLVYSQNSPNSPTLSLKSVPAGVYLLRVTDTEGREYHQKIVKK